MNWDQTLLLAGSLIALLITLLVLRKVILSIRGRTPAERARRNFAKHHLDRAAAPKREARRMLVRRFFRGCWRSLLWCFGLLPKSGRVASRVMAGPSMRATSIQHRPPSGRVSKVSRRINKPV